MALPNWLQIFRSEPEPEPEPADLLPPELDDMIEWIEVGDYVRIVPHVQPDDAPQFCGFIIRVRADLQWALVRYAHSDVTEWFSVEELFLVLKRAALEAEAASA